MNHEQLEESLSLYTLGALDPDSVREVEAHLATGCPACRALLRQYQAAVTMLPYSLPLQTPPPDLKSRIMASLSGQGAPTTSARADSLPATIAIPTAPPGLTPPRESSWIPKDLPERPPPPPRVLRRREFAPWQDWMSQAPALAAVLGVLVLSVGAYAYYLYSTMGAERAAGAQDRTALAKANLEISDLRSQLADQQAAVNKAKEELKRAVEALGTTHELLARHQEQIETLQAKLQAGRGSKDRYRTDLAKAGDADLIRILTSPTAKMASLSGTDIAKDAYAMVFVEPDMRRGFFYANNLPALPVGTTYQLWVITDKPISAGVFTLDRGRKGRLMMRDTPDVRHIKKFAVSLEPEGGRSRPTGSIYLTGAP